MNALEHRAAIIILDDGTIYKDKTGIFGAGLSIDLSKIYYDSHPKLPLEAGMIESLCRAWTDAGSHPEYHKKCVNSLAQDWPPLYYAIDNIVRYLTAGENNGRLL